MDVIKIFIGIAILIFGAYVASYYYSRYNWDRDETRQQRLKELRDSGQITEENYQKAKKYKGTMRGW